MKTGNLKKPKPITPSLRHMVYIQKPKPVRNGITHIKMKTAVNSKAGRNYKGIVTVRHRCRYSKKMYRLVNFYYDPLNIRGHVLTIEYDPHRSCFISLIKYDNGYYSYKLTPNEVSIGDTVLITSNITNLSTGIGTELKYISEGTYIHNIETRPDRGGSLSRAAGTYGVVLNRSSDSVSIKYPSKITKILSPFCKATIGVVSNIQHSDEVLGKAGRARRFGKRPSVRGVAMNPVDHPHGGGEGKKSKRKDVVNYTGNIHRGKKTKHKKKVSHMSSKLNKLYL